MTTILTKKKDSSGAPATADITSSVGGAELAVNTADKRLYTKNSSNNIVEVGTNPASLNLNADLTNTSGNLTVDPATNIFEIKGGGSTDAELKLNCRSNSHGQTIKSQEHSAEVTNVVIGPRGGTQIDYTYQRNPYEVFEPGVTNTMLLPKGANSTLVSEVGTATLTNKTFDIVTDSKGDIRDLNVSRTVTATAETK